jgi:hypothetical protein
MQKGSGQKEHILLNNFYAKGQWFGRTKILKIVRHYWEDHGV